MKNTEMRSACPISQVLDLLGDSWSLLIVRDAVLFGKRRYSEFLAGDEGISTNILAQRLKRLQGQGLMEKFPDPEDGKSFVYLPTEQGLSLLPVLVEMMRWGVNNGRFPGSVDPPEFMRRLLEEGNEWLVKMRREELASERERLLAGAVL